MTYEQFMSADTVFLWAKARRYVGPYRVRKTRVS